MANNLKSQNSENEALRVGTVAADPVIAVAQYAVDQGMQQDRVENLIGTPLNSQNQGELLPAIVGPDLMMQIVEDGLGQAPAIEIAQKAPYSFFGGLERSLLLAPTGREALKMLRKNFALFHDQLISHFEETRTYTKFSFRFAGEERDNGCCNEVVLSVLLRLIRSVFGNFGQPYEVHFRHSRNGVRKAYEDFFGAQLQFHSLDESFSLIFRRKDMAWHQPGHDPFAYSLVSQQLWEVASRRNRLLPNTNFFELINAAHICVSRGLLNVAAVSATAGLAERTAQRIAQQHGTTVGQLIDKERLRTLREQIERNPNVSADDLSRLIGLSDARALRRALKAWTGKTISEFRASPFQELAFIKTSYS